MVRFIRALIYGAFIAVAATFVLDWLDRDLNRKGKREKAIPGGVSEKTIGKMDDEAKKALLDELSSQV